MRFNGVYQGYDGWAHRFLPDGDNPMLLLTRSGEFSEKHSAQLEGKEGKRCTFIYNLSCNFPDFICIKISSDIEFPS